MSKEEQFAAVTEYFSTNAKRYCDVAAFVLHERQAAIAAQERKLLAAQQQAHEPAFMPTPRPYYENTAVPVARPSAANGFAANAATTQAPDGWDRRFGETPAR